MLLQMRFYELRVNEHVFKTILVCNYIFKFMWVVLKQKKKKNNNK